MGFLLWIRTIQIDHRLQRLLAPQPPAAERVIREQIEPGVPIQEILDLLIGQATLVLGLPNVLFACYHRLTPVLLETPDKSETKPAPSYP